MNGSGSPDVEMPVPCNTRGGLAEEGLVYADNIDYEEKEQI